MIDSLDLPELKDELERKTLETYRWIIQMSSSGQMTDSEVKVAMQTAFNIVSGLVDSSIYTAAELVDADGLASAQLKRVFVNKVGDVISISWICGGYEVIARTYFSNDPVEPATEKYIRESTPEKARSTFERMCASAATRWSEIN